MLTETLKKAKWKQIILLRHSKRKEQPLTIVPNVYAPSIITMEDSPIVVDYFEIAPDDIPIVLHKEEVHALSILFTILFHMTPFFRRIVNFFVFNFLCPCF